MTDKAPQTTKPVDKPIVAKESPPEVKDAGRVQFGAGMMRY